MQADVMPTAMQTTRNSRYTVAAAILDEWMDAAFKFKTCAGRRSEMHLFSRARDGFERSNFAQRLPRGYSTGRYRWLRLDPKAVLYL